MTIDVRIDGDLAKILAGEVQAAEAAVTAAIHKAGEGLKRDLRAQINGAGLGRRLANAVRLQIYPEQGRSLSAAAWVFARPGKGGRGGAADIVAAFDEGTLIRRAGGRYLAIPTENVPMKGRGRRMTPDDMQNAPKFGGFGRDLELVPTNRRGVLLLVLPVVRAKNGKGFQPATKRRLRKGRREEWVVMFILVRQVQMPRLLDWREAAQSWGAKLPDLVVREWKAQDGVSRNGQQT
jgi:hypothetical protein